LIIEAEEIKFKEITKEERAVYLRRLLRFKYPPDKQRRVFEQILTTHSIEPKISKKVFNSMSWTDVNKFVSEIWNYNYDGDFENNKALYADDVRCFNSRKMLEDLLCTSLDEEPDLAKMPKLFEDLDCDYPLWAQSYDDFYFAFQSDNPLNMPYLPDVAFNKILLVEGATEEILIPKFAQILGYDLLKKGILLIASGGKNQVVKDYLFHRENLNLPIAIVLDSDAKEQHDSILSVLREQDEIMLLQEGEFEDLLCVDLILKALNSEFKNTAQFSKDDLSGDESMTHKLYELYKLKGVGEFKKVEFAKMILEAVENRTEIGEKLEKLVEFIIQV
jgi:hypothetical protein